MASTGICSLFLHLFTQFRQEKFEYWRSQLPQSVEKGKYSCKVWELFFNKFGWADGYDMDESSVLYMIRVLLKYYRAIFQSITEHIWMR